MRNTWICQARSLNQIMDANDDTKTHMYLEQLLLFPLDIQDKIIEEISHLKNCNSEDVASIIGNYSMMDLQ